MDYLVQDINRRFLLPTITPKSKTDSHNMASSSVVQDVSIIYNRVIPQELKDTITNSIEFGSTIEKSAFDDMILDILPRLVGLYRHFLYGEYAGRCLWMDYPYDEDFVAQSFHINAILIQCRWRIYKSKKYIMHLLL